MAQNLLETCTLFVSLLPFDADWKFEIDEFDRPNDTVVVELGDILLYITEGNGEYYVSADMSFPGSWDEPPAFDVYEIGTTKTLEDAVFLAITELLKEAARQANRKLQLTPKAERAAVFLTTEK